MTKPDSDLFVICVHGLWMRGMEMGLFRHRLRKNYGFTTTQYSYHSITEGLVENSRRLRQFVDQAPAETVHLVAHSLGGVLALQMLQQFPTDKVGRVVCLGSPLVDSSAARNLARSRHGRAMLGRTIREAVLEEPLESFDDHHEVGVIAGTFGLGLGSLVGRLEKPHDGVVTVRETQLPGITEHLTMAVNHFGLVVFREVVEQTSHFLLHGAFSRDQ
jgi:pimeloyl-ACP methyl ester carboxylesterase